ncbi:hypothetical protein BOTBODRAFT_352451 [Botryobasidium botryosum FD-172 SS1]|uniref:Uncharacterized protein n=1 Tax=Botryobasidium botryosum (strain FD-172 SS1) TaxID=930990 RepID=A0A067MF35_BOTB1|nr:hypothetical protein BOTBODRAFT_352451 [Botryobasidium botryosum FD-172 SS1]
MFTDCAYTSVHLGKLKIYTARSREADGVCQRQGGRRARGAILGDARESDWSPASMSSPPLLTTSTSCSKAADLANNLRLGVLKLLHSNSSTYRKASEGTTKLFSPSTSPMPEIDNINVWRSRKPIGWGISSSLARCSPVADVFILSATTFKYAVRGG